MRNSFLNKKLMCIVYTPLLLLLLLTLSLAITNVSAGISPYSPADAISVEPSWARIDAVGQMFSVNITITNITDFAGLDFLVWYNNTILEVAEATDQTDPDNPMSSTQMSPLPGDRTFTNLTSQALGRAGFSSIYALMTTYNGSGVAAKITFKGIMVGNSTLEFDTEVTKAYDFWGDDILFTTFNDGEIEVIPEFPAAIIIPLLLIATLAATFLTKIVWSKKHRGPATT